MTIELTEDEMLETVKALETVKRLHEERELPARHLTHLIQQLRLRLPGSKVRLRSKPQAWGSQGA